MKVIYTLVNVRDKHRLVPPGQAWKWIYEIDGYRQARIVFEEMKRKIRDSRLRLANLYISESSTYASLVRPIDIQYKGPVLYDDQIHVSRIIHMHLDSPDDKEQIDPPPTFRTFKGSNDEKFTHA